MGSHRAAVACVVIAAVLAVLFQPRFIWGNGSGSIVSFDDLFYAAQWAAVLFGVVGLVFWIASWKNGQVPSRAWIVLAVDIVVLVFLAMTGVPHKANRTEWRSGALGITHFMRGESRRRAANAPPTQVSADTFAGTWRAIDGSTYTFSANRIAVDGPSSMEYTAARCGSAFSLQYIERDREALQDLGLTWSEHAIAVYDSTEVDARIPVAQLTCGTEGIVFMRASPNEIWRWTSALELDAIKSAAFVLQRVTDAAK